MQISVDGFVATGPNDEQKWVTWAWDEIKPYVLELHDTVDTQIIGRKLAVDFIPYWQDVVTRPGDPMHALAQRVVDFRKIIFTKTLKKSDPITNGWERTELSTGGLVSEVNKLKNQKGKDILVVGGSSFVSSLIEAGLIDEFYLFVNPVVLGSGVPIFNKLGSFQQLELKKSVVYDCGIAMLKYQLKK